MRKIKGHQDSYLCGANIRIVTEKLKYRKEREEALKFPWPFWLFKKRWDFRSTINMTDNLMEERA